MAKKQAPPEETQLPEEENGEPTDPSDALGELDFDVQEEYKPEPLIPKGVYHAVATKVTFDAPHYSIVWDFCLQNNGGVMNDGETPVDGAHAQFRNWLPKPGDEALMTASGRSTKRQSKINQLQRFQSDLGIDMSTPVKIATALNEAQWIGVEADVEIDVDEYEGRFRNVINRVRKSSL